MQPLFTFNGIYKDSFGEEKIIVSSNGKYLTTTIRGIEFSGNGFDSFVVSDSSMDLSKLPLCGKNNDDLYDCYFNIEIPFFVEIHGKIQEIKASYETWNSKVISSEASNFKSTYLFKILIDTIIYENQEADLYSSMRKLMAQLPTHIKLKCCYTCKLSLYEPQERPQMGEILCFKGIKNEFLQIDRNSKHTFYNLELGKKITMYTTESYFCSEYLN